MTLEEYVIKRKREDGINEFDLEKRKKIFWSIFYFSSRVKVKLRTIIVDKKFMNRKNQVRQRVQ